MARKSKLHKEKDWPVVAKDCFYHPGMVAERVHVSLRYLELFFLAEFGEAPHKIFARWRMARIKKLARERKTGAEIAKEVGLANRANLSRVIMEETGCTLAGLRGGPPKRTSEIEYKNKLSKPSKNSQPFSGRMAENTPKASRPPMPSLGVSPGNSPRTGLYFGP